jgi:hypothetical protein
VYGDLNRVRACVSECLEGVLLVFFVIEYVIRTHVFAFFFHVWRGRCRRDFGGRGKIMDLNINETRSISSVHKKPMSYN